MNKHLKAFLLSIAFLTPLIVIAYWGLHMGRPLALMALFGVVFWMEEMANIYYE